jgi:transcriptional regulator with XRE-family HTH domain
MLQLDCKYTERIVVLVDPITGGRMLKDALNAKMHENGLSTREAAREIGVSHTTIFRVMKGGPFDVPTLIAIANWLGVRPSTLLDNIGSSDTICQVALLVEGNPGILQVLDKAVKSVNAGEASPEIVQDIIAYALYKTQLREATANVSTERKGKRAAKRS